MLVFGQEPSLFRAEDAADEEEPLFSTGLKLFAPPLVSAQSSESDHIVAVLAGATIVAVRAGFSPCWPVRMQLSYLGMW